MKQVLLTSAAVLMAVSSAAFAATTSNDATTTTREPAVMGATPAPTTRAPSSMASGTTTNRAAAMNTADATGMFTNIPSGEDLSSNVVGLNVYNNANQDIGKIKDIAFDANGVKAYIVAVGGFLGMGDHYVAVNPSAININYDANAKKWHAAMNTNADQLKAAPEYKYSSND